MVDTPEEFRRSANEARRLAAQAADQAAKDNWYAIADDYDRRARNFCDGRTRTTTLGMHVAESSPAATAKSAVKFG